MSCGILQFQIMEGHSIDLHQKKHYFLLATFPLSISKSPQLRTSSLPLEGDQGLPWNLSRDIVLTGQVTGTEKIEMSIWESNKVLSDHRIGDLTISLDALARGEGIESVDYTFRGIGESKKDLLTVTMKVCWKDDNVPDYVRARMDPGAGGVEPELGALGSDPTAASLGAGAGGKALAPRAGGVGPKPLPPCKDQDYSVRIWFHRATNLQSVKDDKLYNPRGVAEVLGKTYRTQVVKETLEPHFDEEATFNFTRVSETFWNEPIQLTVINSRLGPSETIGTVVLDMQTVYNSPQHFMQKKWMVLHKSISEGNVMGFMKVSLAVTNLRTDAFPEMDEEDDDDEASDEVAIANLMSSAGSIFEEVNLFCDVIRGEGIPQMDAGPSAAADPYVKLIFGKRTVSTVNVRNTLNPVWNTQVTLPMTLPSLTSTIAVQVWDYDRGQPDDLNGTVNLNFAKFPKVGRGGMPYLPPQWINIYGHPRPCDADYNSYFKKMANGEKKGIDYRGRVLLRMMGYSGHGTPPMAPIKETTVELTLALQVLQFNMIPDRGKYKVRISVGNTAVSSRPRDTTKMIVSSAAGTGADGLHSVYFGEQLQLKATFSVIAPEEDNDASIESQIPDVLFQLVEDGTVAQQLSTLNPLAALSAGRGEVEPYSSCRFPIEEVLGKSNKGKVFYKCKAMRRSVDADKLNEGRPPANPIAQVVVGGFISDVKPETPKIAIKRGLEYWPSENVNQNPMEKFVLECCVYQAKQIPAGDSNGLSDPFVRVSWANATAVTGIKLETLNPNYHEMLRIVADTKQKFPDVVVEVWDWDLVGRNTFLCKSVLKFDQLRVDDDLPKDQMMQWFEHFTDSFGNRVEGCGVLLSFKILKGVPAVLNNVPAKVKMPKRFVLSGDQKSSDTYDGYPIPIDRAMNLSKYTFDVKFFALRHMRKFHLRELRKPTIEMTVGGRNFVVCTGVGANPDFNQRLQFTLELPSNPAFFPQMLFRVFDHRIGPRVLVGTAVISADDEKCNPLLKKEQLEDADEHIQSVIQWILEAKQGILDGASPTRAAAPEDQEQTAGPKTLLGGIGKAVTFGGRLSFKSKPKKKKSDAVPSSSEEMEQPLLSETTNADYRLEVDKEDDEDTVQVAVEEDVSVQNLKPVAPKKLTAADLDDVVRSAFDVKIPDDQKSDYSAISDTSTEPDEELWFDCFDPEGQESTVSAEKMVSRLGRLKVLPLGHTTCEDHFGPFNDHETEIEFNRGWGKKSIKAGLGIIDVDVLTVSEDTALTTATPVPQPLSNRRQQPFIIRVYVLNCRHLAAMDDGPLGKSSDPYLILSLSGSASSKNAKNLNCKDLGKFQTLNPDFFFMKEMSGSLPEHGRLEIAVYDYDKIGRDEEIGTTEINLEQRWYSSRGYQNQGSSTLRPGSYSETRPLRNKGGLIQGSIELWVDMFDPNRAGGVPRPIDITPPPPVELEIRAMVWNTRDVVLVDNSFIGGEKMTDIYVRCWMDGMRNDVQNTDVHYRSLDGTGNFNWRMNFRCVLEPRTKKVFPLESSKSKIASFFSIRKEQKKYIPMVHCQIFDNDLLPGTDDFIGETTIDLLGITPTKTRRDQQSILGLITGDVATCNCWPFNKCCGAKKRDLSLAERQQLAMAEAKTERRAKYKEWKEVTDQKIKVLRETGQYNEQQLDAMRRTIMKEQKKASVTNILEPFLPQKKKKNIAKQKPSAPNYETGKYWVACRGPFGGGRVGDVQISFEVVRVDAIEKDKETYAAGKGRSEPQKLPEPDRPDSSFFWLSSPWKAAVHILWKNYKWYLLTIICLVLSAIFLYYFLTEGIQVKSKKFFS